MWFRPLGDDATTTLAEEAWHGRLARVFQHWRSLAPVDGMPAYGRLQLRSLAPDLRFLATLDVAGPEFQFVSVGEEIAERYGRTLVGSYLADQFIGPSQMDIIAAHRACSELQTPVLCAVEMKDVDLSSRVPFQLLLLPFAETHGIVDHILWVMAFPT